MTLLTYHNHGHYPDYEKSQSQKLLERSLAIIEYQGKDPDIQELSNQFTLTTIPSLRIRSASRPRKQWVWLSHCRRQKIAERKAVSNFYGFKVMTLNPLEVQRVL